MLEVYDRVLPSHSVPTLVALIILATILYAALGCSILFVAAFLYASAHVSTKQLATAFMMRL